MSADRKPQIIDALDTLRQKELAAGQVFKARAYDTVIKQIRKLDHVYSLDDLAALTGIGKKIHAKIEEILTTGELKAAKNAVKAYDIEGFKELLNVYGIGPAKARALHAAGIHNVAALRAAAHVVELTDAQKLGLEYYEDLLERIPRAEMTRHEKFLMKTLADNAPGLTGLIVGSYRRGAKNSGDIDMLVTVTGNMTAAAAQKEFAAFIAALDAKGYILATLASGAKKYMGISSIGARGAPGKGTGRRLDLLLTPRAEYAPAVLYFTGSDKFNIAFRRHALSLGYTLNEHELKATGEGVPHPPAVFKDEASIFEFLGLKYVKPEDRDGSTIGED